MFTTPKNYKSSLGFKISILALGSIATMCTGLIAPALPKIAREYSHLPHYQLLTKFVITMPHFMVLFLTPFLGFLTDKFNRKYLLCGAVLVYGVAGAACAFVNNLYIIIGMRAILGVCMSTALVVTATLIADCLKGDERSMIMGLQKTFFSIATTTMYGLGGIVADINWHYCFLLYLLPTIMVPFGWKHLYEPRNNADYMAHKESEITDVKHVKQNNAAIASIYVIAFTFMIMQYMIPLQIPFLLDEMGLNSKQISLFLMADVTAVAIFASRYKKWKKNRSFITMCTLSFALMSLGYIIIGLASNYAIIFGALIVCGMAMGIMMPNNGLWLTYSVGVKNRGILFGGLSTAIYSSKSMSAIVLYPLIRYTSLRLSFVFASFTMIVIAISVLYGSEKINSDTNDAIDDIK